MERPKQMRGGFGALMALALAAGMPAAAVDPKDNPARRAYAGTVRDLIKAQGIRKFRPFTEKHEPVVPSLKRLGRRILEKRFAEWSGGKRMSTRCYRHSLRHLRRDWIPNRLITTEAAGFAIWYRKRFMAAAA